MLRLIESLVRRVPWPDLLAAVALACCELTSTYCFAGTTDKDFTRLRDAVVAGQRENRARLPNCYTVAWHRQSYENGFKNGQADEGDGVRTSGDYQQWQSGRKLATKYVQDHVMASRRPGDDEPITNADKPGGEARAASGKAASGAIAGDSAKPRIERFGQRTASNGEDFRVVPNVDDPKRLGITNEPDYRPHENWLGVIGWDKPSVLELMRNDAPPELVLDHWEVRDDADSHLCEIAYRNTDTDLTMSLLYNLDRGCELERRTIRLKGGALGSDESRKLLMVGDGCWFPVEITSRAVGRDGNDTLRHEYTVDLAASSFGDCGAIPADVFTINVTPSMRVSDYRAGRKVVYTGESSPLSMVELTARANPFMGRPMPWILAALYAHWMLTISTGGALLLAVVILRWRRNLKIQRAKG